MQRQRQPADSRLSVGKGFGRCKKEEEKAVRKAGIKENRALTQFREAWENYRGDDIYDFTIAATELIKNISYDAKDVEAFCVVLQDQEFQDDEDFDMKAGHLLSALINKGRDERYVVHTKFFGKEIEFLGSHNSKEIIVHGNVGFSAGDTMQSGVMRIMGDAVGGNTGYDMKGGKIIVEGNVDKCTGMEMSGGEIVVEGNVVYPWDHSPACWLGSKMSGGRIIVKGNAGRDVGDEMTGGEIHLEGDYESLGNIKGGKIYHKGKLIVDETGVPRK